MYADDERINEWHLCTVEVFMHSLHENPPPEVSCFPTFINIVTTSMEKCVL